MGIFDIFSKRDSGGNWDPTHRATIKEVSYEDIVDVLGAPTKSKSRYVYWRGPLSDIDPDYPEDEYYQLSNKHHHHEGWHGKTPSIKGETWFAIGTSPSALRIVGREIGGLVRDVEEI